MYFWEGTVSLEVSLFIHSVNQSINHQSFLRWYLINTDYIQSHHAKIFGINQACPLREDNKYMCKLLQYCLERNKNIQEVQAKDYACLDEGGIISVKERSRRASYNKWLRSGNDWLIHNKGKNNTLFTLQICVALIEAKKESL